VIGTLQCDACWIAGDVVESVMENKVFQGVIETGAILVCSMGLDFGICRGYVDSLADVIIENLLDLILTPGYICSEILAACEHDYYKTLDPNVFIKAMLSDKPAAALSDNFVDTLYNQISNDPSKDERPTLKIVQFTDIHLDLMYVSGTAKVCDYVICCRAVNGYPTDKS
jgi:hypothetical protein